MLFVLLVGCANDPLAAFGLSPEIVPLTDEPVELAEPAAPVVSPDAAPGIPSTPPMSGADIASGGAKEGAPEGGGGASPAAPVEGAPPAKFDPISVPLGPRNTSVKWEGVSKRGEGRVIDLGNGEFADPGLGN